MKLAILLYFIAFTCVTRAQLLSWVSSSSSALLDSAKAKLEDAKNAVGQQIENAVDVVKEKIAAPKEQAEQLLESLTNSGEGLLNGVATTLERTLDKVNQTVDDIAKEAESENVDVSECRSLTSQLRGAAHNLVSKSSNCILDKINTGKSLVSSIISQSREVLSEILGLKNKYNECFEGVEGILATTSATACLSQTGVKTTWTVTKKVPSVAADIARITNLVTNLQTTLPACVSSTLLKGISEESKSALGNVKTCVAKRVEDATGTNL